MKKTNPTIIPRNHIVENVLKIAEQNNLKPFNKLIDLLKRPYQNYDDISDYQKADQNSDKYRTFCGT